MSRSSFLDYTNLVDPSASPMDRLVLNAVYRVLDEIPTDGCHQ